MAAIGWIDFSRNDRDRIGSVLDMLRPEGVVDELGLGTIRDALANQLFPGISTIQTRARYFFFIPYILYEYQCLKPNQRKGKTPSKYLEDREFEIMWELAEKYNYQDGSGVIGITKRRPNKIVRRPSAIYWNGLNTYHFIETRGLAAEIFLRQALNPTVESLLSTDDQGDDGSSDDLDADYENVFRIKVPPNQTWNVNLTLDLQRDEAEFFYHRIISLATNKLISELLLNQQLWKLCCQSKDFMQFVKSAISFDLPDTLKSDLILAHDFSELMYGAHIAYNCQLQHKGFKSDFFEDKWKTWIDNIEKEMLNYQSFDPARLFDYATTTRATTRHFVEEWWQLTRTKFPELRKRDEWIEQQEALVKGSKARLRWAKMDDVKENKWLGLRHFKYRLEQARTIIEDIRKGRSD